MTRGNNLKRTKTHSYTEHKLPSWTTDLTYRRFFVRKPSKYVISPGHVQSLILLSWLLSYFFTVLLCLNYLLTEHQTPDGDVSNSPGTTLTLELLTDWRWRHGRVVKQRFANTHSKTTTTGDGRQLAYYNIPSKCNDTKGRNPLGELVGNPRRQSTSARKDNEPWTGRRAATNSVMRTTVFLAHLLLTVPRTGWRNDDFTCVDICDFAPRWTMVQISWPNATRPTV